MYKGKKVIIIRGYEIILKTEKIFQDENKEINVEEINKITVYDHKFIYESRKHEMNNMDLIQKKLMLLKYVEMKDLCC